MKTIHKNRPQVNYVVLSNSIPQNTALSYEAVGLLTYLLSLADDTVLDVTKLYRTNAKRDKVYRILDELSDAGYIVKPNKYQDDKGHWKWTHYEVYAEPQTDDTPPQITPYPEKPNTGEPNTENTEIKDKVKNNKVKNISGDESPVVENTSSTSPDKLSREAWDTLCKLITEYFKLNGSAVYGMANYLRGTAKDNRYVKYMTPFTTQPITPDELQKFWKWYQVQCPGCDLRSPEKIESYMLQFRNDATWQRLHQYQQSLKQRAEQAEPISKTYTLPAQDAHLFSAFEETDE